MTAQLNKNENLIWNTLSTRRLRIKYEYPVSLVFRTECGGDMWQSSSSKISHLEGVIKYSFIHIWTQKAKKFWAGDSPGNFLSISKIKRKESITSAPIHNMGYVIFSHILTWQSYIKKSAPLKGRICQTGILIWNTSYFEVTELWDGGISTNKSPLPGSCSTVSLISLWCPSSSDRDALSSIQIPKATRVSILWNFQGSTFIWGEIFLLS